MGSYLSGRTLYVQHYYPRLVRVSLARASGNDFDFITTPERAAGLLESSLDLLLQQGGAS